jgi:hypothetical protein
MEGTDGSTSSPLDEEEGECSDGTSSSSSSLSSSYTRRRQLWLDLRDTAIRPAEALAFLDEFLDEFLRGEFLWGANGNSPDELPVTEMNYVVDRIILPEETYRGLPKHCSSSSTCGVDLVVVENGGSLIPVSAPWSVESDVTSQPRSKGTLIRPGDSLLNPLESLEIYNRGDWIVFDSAPLQGDADAISAWIDEVGSLLQLLPVTASPQQSRETPSGLMLPLSDRATIHTTTSLAAAASSKKTGIGGVGIFCSTREALFRADTLLEQLAAGAGATESFASGILLPAVPDKDGTTCPAITSALVLPFDLNLWRSVLEMRHTT